MDQKVGPLQIVLYELLCSPTPSFTEKQILFLLQRVDILQFLLNNLAQMSPSLCLYFVLKRKQYGRHVNSNDLPPKIKFGVFQLKLTNKMH